VPSGAWMRGMVLLLLCRWISLTGRHVRPADYARRCRDGKVKPDQRGDSPLTSGPTMSGMLGYLSIGDFSRASHMTGRTLRHYHQVGLLEPAGTDPRTGHRRYAAGQIAAAQVNRRFRDLGMPLEQFQAVLAAPDQHGCSQQITAHLSRLEDELGRTQAAVAARATCWPRPRPAGPRAARPRPTSTCA